jgi:catechol 2,3-dioxygenase-like lactoylglutathione lyase family enzyme
LDHEYRSHEEELMLGQTDAHANLAVRDLAVARRFYERTLGLAPVHEEDGELVVYKSGNSLLNVYRSDYAGTNRATAVTWTVDDVDGEVSDLKNRGVTFEHYDMPGLTRKGDVHIGDDLKVAWFKDPDGNILNLVNR